MKKSGKKREHCKFIKMLTNINRKIKKRPQKKLDVKKNVYL